MTKSEENKEVKKTAAGTKRFLYSDFGGLPADSRIQVKMPESYRDYWIAAARREKKSLSSVICELLKKQYGEPPLGGIDANK
jgi:hypothetical protein